MAIPYPQYRRRRRLAKNPPETLSKPLRCDVQVRSKLCKITSLGATGLRAPSARRLRQERRNSVRERVYKQMFVDVRHAQRCTKLPGVTWSVGISVEGYQVTSLQSIKIAL